ncbi:hypothetical protein RUM44_011534 [Polyplax serrata]|uniref:C2H2-type domain-containing protein n=1 Tax=Polyplax serrata TaxID=468196 RepID=A0ABR1AQB1_POLSC
MVPQKGMLILNATSINSLKAKDRRAAQVLEEVGLNEIEWIKNEFLTKHYICPFESCTAFFVDLYLLKNHFFKTHNGRPFKCDFNNCKWSFATKSKLERHKNSHLNIKWFKCLHESCSKMFTTLYNLRQHLKTVHEKAEQFVCTVNNCNAAFHNQRSLDLHKATHGNLEPPYSCEQGCAKSFITRNALCSHMRSHEHKLEDLKCSWEGCDKIFELPCRLREHMRTHTGEKPFRCDHPGCGWSFYSGSKLHRHRNKHLQIRKYVCCISHCNKSFLRSQHLKEHILTHSKNNSKNFSCPFEACDSKFGSKNLVYRHVKKVHRKEDQKLDSSNEINDFTTKLPNAENEHNQPEQPQFTKRESIGQLDSVTLLPGDFDVCSTENVPLNTSMPSELLVAMTSIDCGTGDSLADISSIDASCNNQSMVVMEANINEALVINDNNVQYVVNGSPVSKNKKKVESSGAARTHYTYKDVIREKTYKTELEESRRVKWLQETEPCTNDFKSKKWKNLCYSKQSEDIQNCKMSIPSDLVLGAGVSDHHSLIVKDELYTQEDLQVLLLDQGITRNSIFEPSTINLRDLE